MRRMKMLFNTLMLCCVCVMLSTPSHAHVNTLPAGIDVNLSMAKTQLNATDAVMVEVSYTNVTNQAIRLLKHGTALEGWLSANIFSVNQNGKAMPYTGALLKRVKPRISDYIVLQPRQTISGTVDLAQGYDIRVKGRYSVNTNSRVQAKGLLSPFGFKPNLNFDLLQSKPVDLTLFAQPATFASCSTIQRNSLTAALTEAERISRIAATDLSNTPTALRSGAARYVRWFGTYNAARYNLVSRNFNNIYAAARNRVVNFNCACLDVPPQIRNQVIAYVFPGRAYQINICPVYNFLSPTGTDSQAGTLVHELSHFSVVAATNANTALYPEVYGTSAAFSLARTNPNHAVNNAENHEYFAENTPAVAMPVATPSNEFSAGFLMLLLDD